jgi:carboxymethylenebutenolidase
MSDQTFTLTTPDGQMDLYEATPTGDARGAVVVIQEAFGVNEHIKDVTRRFAVAGYHAVAPALFHRAGGGTAGYEDFGAVIPLFEGVSDDGVLADIDAALDHLRAAGFSDPAIGVVGFCFGGRASFLVSVRRALGAGVGFYGGGIVSKHGLGFDPLIDEAKTLRTPWLGLFGDADGGIPVEDVEMLRTALQGALVETEIVRYPDAEHGFHCDVRDAYHPEAAADAWKRTLAWFEAHLAPPA